MFPMTVLLVEDNPRDIELILEAFAENNFTNQITVARDGSIALDYLYRRGEFAGRSDRNPVVILLDIKMPKVDGLEVLRTIKGDPELKRIPVVMMTSSREQSDLIKSYDLGVNSYVVKPVKFTEFVEAVKSIELYWLLVNQPAPEISGFREGES